MYNLNYDLHITIKIKSEYDLKNSVMHTFAIYLAATISANIVSA